MRSKHNVTRDVHSMTSHATLHIEKSSVVSFYRRVIIFKNTIHQIHFPYTNNQHFSSKISILCSIFRRRHSPSWTLHSFDPSYHIFDPLKNTLWLMYQKKFWSTLLKFKLALPLLTSRNIALLKPCDQHFFYSSVLDSFFYQDWSFEGFRS